MTALAITALLLLAAVCAYAWWQIESRKPMTLRRTRRLLRLEILRAGLARDKRAYIHAQRRLESLRSIKTFVGDRS